MNLNIIKTIHLKASAEGVDQTTASVKKLGSAQNEVVKSAAELAKSSQAAHERLERYAKAMHQAAEAMRRYEQFQRIEIATAQAQAAANLELARSFSAANDNAKESAAGFHLSGIEAASMENHLKSAAGWAYALSPAFRGMVNASLIPVLRGVATGVSATGAAIKAAGSQIVAGGAALASLGPKFEPIAAGIKSAGTALEGFTPTVGGAVSALSPLLASLARLAFLIALPLAAIAFLVSGIRDGIQAFSDFQTKQVELENILKATGSAAGRTASDINKLAEDMGDIGNARQAAKTLLEFQNISGQTFDRALKAANDLASAGMGNISTAAGAMGKALADPASGLDGLTKAGVQFTAQQKALIKELQETGRVAEYQNAILAIVEGRVGGSATAAANTLSGAYQALADATKKGSEQFGQQIASVTNLQKVVQALADSLNALNNFTLSDTARTAIDMIMRGVFKIKGRLAPPPDRLDPIDREQAAAAGNIRTRQQELDLARAGVDAINKESEALRKSALQKEIDTELRKRHLREGTLEAQQIAEATTKRFNLNQQIEDEKKKRQAAEAQAKSDLATWERAINTVERHSIGLAANTLAIGKSAGVQEQLRGEFTLLQRAQETHKGVTDQQIDAFIRLRGTMSAQQALVEAGIKLNKDDELQLIRSTEAARKRAEENAKARITDQIGFETRTAGMSQEDVQIAQRLSAIYPDVTEAINSSEAAQMRLNNRINQSTELANNFTQSLLKGLLEGKNGFDVLVAAAGQLGQAMLDIGTKDISKGLTSGVKGMFDNKGLGGFAFEPASMAMAGVGAIISLWAGNEQKKKAEIEAQHRAWEQWQAAALQVDSYFAKAQGVNRGAIKQALAPSREAANDNKSERSKDDRDQLPAAAAA